ncbi:type II toxin-antitoxin system Phd/YefM family antitoxin [Pseudorhizobium marinum]|uniref:type II toxin-antitoxin system Phd/YefM family antitoxin n=1 Tax=Pseudorhizobium marinum TaxID=1496690 RepID=UPI0004977FA5|nr:type II toxin-antitoxin system prevent-host-death family antitoxin [Pseudorhizobium marinum]
MTITVNVGDADLTELLAKVEAGEDVVLTRNNTPIARMSAVAQIDTRAELIETIIRERSGRKPVTQQEIAEWKQIGRR